MPRSSGAAQSVGESPFLWPSDRALSTSVAPYFLAVAALSTTGGAVYNHIGAQRTSFDDLAHEHFEKSRQIIDISDRDHSYVYPKPVGPQNNTGPVYVQEHCVQGSVLVLYIIESDGSVTSPFVARSSNPALSMAVLARAANMRFIPAKLDGRTVATVAATQFRSLCPPDAG